MKHLDWVGNYLVKTNMIQVMIIIKVALRSVKCMKTHKWEMKWIQTSISQLLIQMKKILKVRSSKSYIKNLPQIIKLLEMKIFQAGRGNFKQVLKLLAPAQPKSC